jgi:DNA-binding IclR family transcriptional regulator
MPIAQPTTKSAEAGIQVITRAAAILRSLDGHPNGLSLAQIATEVSLPRSTVHRITSALTAEGLVEAASTTGGLRLGPAISRLAQGGRPSLRDRMHPIIERLSAKLNETVDLAVLDGPEMRFIDQVEGPQRLSAASAIDARFPLHCTANGKAALAVIGSTKAAALLPAKLERFTSATTTGKTKLASQLAGIKASGVAFDVEEYSDGICAAGIAWAEPDGQIAAISVPIPTQRFTGREAQLTLELTKVLAQINDPTTNGAARR